MFKQKVIKVTLTLDDKEESFVANAQHNQLSYTGLRVSYHGNFGNGALSPTAQILIYGMPMEKMDKLLRIRWGGDKQLRSYIKIEVGNAGEALHTEYQGTITFARLDMTNAPDFSLVIESLVAYTENMKPVQPTSYKEGEKVQDAIQSICKNMGYQFENNGVDQVMSDTNLDKTDYQKVVKLCQDYNLEMYSNHRFIAIAPEGIGRNKKPVILSPMNGLVGYPTQTTQGIVFSCLYNPLIMFGGYVEIKDSLVSMANGVWRIYGVRTNLEANTPNGNWMMEVNAEWDLREDSLAMMR